VAGDRESQDDGGTSGGGGGGGGADGPGGSDGGARDGEEQGEVREVAVAGDLPIYVVRGARAAQPAVFLTGSCTTPLAYVQAFRKAAAANAGLVALQGDLPCRDAGRRWSPDTRITAARIEAALRAAGFGEPRDVTLIGYSQGAERAEWLALRFPETYTRFVLMAGPVVPSAARLARARGVVTLAGHGDVRETMAEGARLLRRRSIPAVYMELPGGMKHGTLAPAADEVVARAFAWLGANARGASEGAVLEPETPRAPSASPRPTRARRAPPQGDGLGRPRSKETPPAAGDP
jgi:pimeloyl-ACP methyl ester carboxylesterase